MKKSVSITDRLIETINEFRRFEKPIPSFSTMLERLAWRGASGYEKPRIDFEKVPLLEFKTKYCDHCGSEIDGKFCWSCGALIPSLTHES